MRLLLRVVGVLALLAIAALVLVLLFAGRIGKAAVEGGGSWALGVPVKADDVDLGLLGGAFEIEKLTVANPPNFSAEPFLSLGSASADWKTGSLLSDEIEVEKIALSGLTLRLEQRLGSSNYGAILDHLKEVAPESKDKPAEDGGKRLRVAQIVVRDVTAEIVLPDLPQGSDRARVHVPEVVITDFRTGGETSEMVGKLLGAVVKASLAASLEAGGATIPADWSKDLRARLESEVDQRVRDALEGIIDLPGLTEPRAQPK